MTEMFKLDFIVQAFLACFIMGVILSYLGIHVVGRGIVFVDLALGQISSLGVAFAGFIGHNAVWIPIAFTLAGALLLSLIHVQDRRIKLEAIIGIVYAVASGVTVLLISKTAHGEADISEVLFGHVLAVSDGDMRNMGIAFALLGLLHLIFYRDIFRLTEAMHAGTHRRWSGRDRLLNFFFYLSIGLAIVFSVRVGGVLPVFSYLVVPPVVALLVSRSRLLVVAIAVFGAVLASLFGLYFSYAFDFPTGASIVAIFGIMFAAAGVMRLVQTKFLQMTYVQSTGEDVHRNMR